MSRPSTLVLVNRAAGRRRAAQIYTSVARYFSDAKCAADFAVPQSADEFCALAIDAARGKYRNVVALGGDGTFHQLANACLNFEVNLGLIPAGSGNDIAAALGIPRDPIEAAHAFIHGAAQPVDVVRVRSCPVEQTAADSKDQAGEEVFIGAGGLGLDAEAAELANTRFRGWTGASRYILGAISARRRATNLEISAEIDELHWEGRVILAAVANGTRYGSGIQIAPQARMNDGYLDVALVGDVSLSRLIEALPIVMRGNIRWPEVTRFQARRFAIRANHAALIHGDGEILGRTPAEFEVIPGAIRVVLPR